MRFPARTAPRSPLWHLTRLTPPCRPWLRGQKADCGGRESRSDGGGRGCGNSGNGEARQRGSRVEWCVACVPWRPACRGCLTWRPLCSCRSPHRAGELNITTTRSVPHHVCSAGRTIARRAADASKSASASVGACVNPMSRRGPHPRHARRGTDRQRCQAQGAALRHDVASRASPGWRVRRALARLDRAGGGGSPGLRCSPCSCVSCGQPAAQVQHIRRRGVLGASPSPHSVRVRWRVAVCNACLHDAPQDLVGPVPPGFAAKPKFAAAAHVMGVARATGTDCAGTPTPSPAAGAASGSAGLPDLPLLGGSGAASDGGLSTAGLAPGTRRRTSARHEARQRRAVKLRVRVTGGGGVAAGAPGVGAGAGNVRMRWLQFAKPLRGLARALTPQHR